ncbi:hypothetical protein [Vibrio cionasavignyae]|uniref:hypothetical protein n=1 Tax=Vibrio cionasavignyae TaxID=2910252 RepID=UPI003D0BB592
MGIEVGNISRAKITMFWTLLMSFLFHFFMLQFVVSWESISSGNFIIGDDEFRYLTRSVLLFETIENSGFLSTVSDYYKYTHSLHWGNYYFIAGVFSLTGVDLSSVAIVKILLFHFLTIPCYYFLVKEFFVRKVAMVISLSLIFYVPLVLFPYTLMRDDLIFMLTNFFIVLYFSYKKNKKYSTLIVASIVCFLLVGFRIHMFLSLIAFVVSDLILYSAILRRHILVKMTISISLALVFILFSLSISSINIYAALIDFPEAFIRVFLSPVPWLVSSELPTVLMLWYSLVFIFMCFICIVFLMKFMFWKSILHENKLLPFLVLFLCYIFPYLANDQLGFRQVTIMMPFLFVFVVFPVLVNGKYLKPC